MAKISLLTEPDNKTADSLIKVWRLTALWGFSEAAFGGVLHALKVPFSGIFISGAAVIFISLIAFYSERRNDIIRATITVVLIKALISPHTPVTAYLAVFIQGLLGHLFFCSKRFFKTSALLLGIAAGVFSGLQKLIVLTVVFGNTLWESLDIFLSYIVSQFTGDSSSFIRYSFILAGFYILLHLIGGFLFGVAAGKIPYRLRTIDSGILDELKIINEELFIKKKKKRSWWRRPTGIIILFFSIIAAAATYITPLAGRNLTFEIIIMLLRSILIMFLWYTFLSPFILKLFNRYLSGKSKKYSDDISKMVSLFPRFKLIISYAWEKSKTPARFQRLKNFFILSFTLLLNDEDLSADR